MTDFAMTIGGRAVLSESEFAVVNPATGVPFAHAPACTADQVDEAMAAAQTAGRSWSRDEAARREALRRVSEALSAASAELAALLTSEQGKPLREARREVESAARWFAYYSQLDVPVDVLSNDSKRRIEVVRRPLGVVAAITAWNFPLKLAAAKLAPALLAGNTVVLKPSPYTPLTTLRLGALIQDAVPPGVVNVITGGDEVGRWMTGHRIPRKISFTGSVAAGMHVAAAAARDLKRVTLELGGNDAAIVMDDVDIESVADSLFWSAFYNNGQICAAVKRVYAPEARYDDLVDALAARAVSARVGDGAERESQLGPLNNAPQRDRIADLVDAARASGGRIVVGGERIDRAGYFYTPTIVAGLDDDAPLVAQEQFGPALPVLRYREVDEAITRANATSFGLSGSVWGSDTERAATIAAELECGTVSVNTHIAGAPFEPLSGHKHSGVGVEGGPWGLEAFTDLQLVHR